MTKDIRVVARGRRIGYVYRAIKKLRDDTHSEEERESLTEFLNYVEVILERERKRKELRRTG